MKICMIASESNPFLKTGGLADVVAALSKELVKNKHDVSVIMPYYQNLQTNFKEFTFEKKNSTTIRMNWRNQECNIYYLNYQNINYYFIKNDYYFTSRSNAYGYADDDERFAFFQLAALKVIDLFNLKFEIIHLHDWQTGMIPLIYKLNYQKVNNPKFIFTIHNAAFLGITNHYNLFDYFNISEEYYENGLTRFNGCVSYLKTGIMTADIVSTVSKTHRNELLESLDIYGLNQCFKYREQDFYGIVNGIDTELWNPTNDQLIYQRYDLDNYEIGKRINKKRFIEEHGFKDNNLPLISIVSRIAGQKGFDILIPGIREILAQKVNLFILGTGDPYIENDLRGLSKEFPDNFKVLFDYNETLSHETYASSDFFLIMSRYEPCGITQMLAQKYGTLPIARKTGGLADTIIPYNNRNKLSNGFIFKDYTTSALVETSKQAIKLYQDKYHFNLIIENAMKVDNSWAKPVKQYLKLYQLALKK